MMKELVAAAQNSLGLYSIWIDNEQYEAIINAVLEKVVEINADVGARSSGAKRKMNIALDYDNTFTADPEFWLDMIASAVASGHDVRIVTARDERFDRSDAMVNLESLIPIVYCRGVAKKWFMSHFGDGFVPDIWIDDRPESIFSNSDFEPAQLADWRATRSE